MKHHKFIRLGYVFFAIRAFGHIAKKSLRKHHRPMESGKTCHITSKNNQYPALSGSWV